MLARVFAISLNTYREAVRARVLLGVFALGLATCAYSAVVATLSLHNELRVVADLGAASLSGYGVLVAVVLGSTSLYRELEHKTIFPILSRPIFRAEYLLGKYLGIVLTVAVFIVIEASAVLALLAIESGQPAARVAAFAGGALVAFVPVALRARHSRDFLAIPWAFGILAVTWALAAPAGEDRQLVAASAVLAVCEVAIVAGVATLFASFSSPFLTATFTGMVFVIGRSTDTLAHLPPKVFGTALAAIGASLARVFPNLQVYVPARPLLLGQVAGHPLGAYVGGAALHALAYATALLVVASFAFRRRDFA
jgi:ABC-type transport system involved in multi-copper enzyme maturation permease subunit